jgi:hypothetical protein
MENRCNSYLEEYMASGNVEQLLEDLSDTTAKLPAGKTAVDLGMKLLEKAIAMVVDEPDNKSLAAALFAPLLKGGMASSERVEELFTEQLATLEDVTVDAPRAPEVYTTLLAHAIHADLAPLGFLNTALADRDDEYSMPMSEARFVKDKDAIGGQAGAAYLAVRVLQELLALEDVSALQGCYAAEPKLDLAALMPQSEREPAAVSALLEAAGLAPLEGGGVTNLAPAKDISKEKELEAVEAHLMASLGEVEPAEADAAGASNDELLQWIATTCSLQPGSKPLARAVMRCILETASGSEEPPVALKITKQIEFRKPLMLKYISCASDPLTPHTINVQAACLYEVQAYCGRKNWPPGLMKKVFYILYETDIIFEDAYNEWREDVVDDTPGKHTALFQVNEFLRWLSEANEEEATEEGEEK